MDSEFHSFSNLHRGFDLNCEPASSSPQFTGNSKSLDLNLMDFPSPYTLTPASASVDFLDDRDVTSSLDICLVRGDECMLQFTRGLEEATQFLPRQNLSTESVIPCCNNKEAGFAVLNSSMWKAEGTKNEEEVKNKKKVAQDVRVDELTELYERLFQSPDVHQSLHPAGSSNAASKRASRVKKKRRNMDEVIVDLNSLLMDCARAIASSDNKRADELLKQVRQHSSQSGNGTQRLAHYFADGLEARLAGTGTPLYAPWNIDPVVPLHFQMMKSIQSFSATCPFLPVTCQFATENILNFAEKVTMLHIIDFGINHGFHWIPVIQLLSVRAGGPPKLRITGIEDYQLGFAPSELLAQTGHRLTQYCERYDIPFEYNGMAREWNTIQMEDLKIEPSQGIAVFSGLRFHKLLDEVDGVYSPRTAVLNLIRKINPSIFIHSIVNGSHNTPLFFPRFQNALYHYSKYFDMLETNFSIENMDRLIYERSFLGSEIVNIIACEGFERVERPETYLQWQRQMKRAGFLQLPLDRKILRKLRSRVKSKYHKDFEIEEDHHWILLGWKGRHLCATCCWIPAT